MKFVGFFRFVKDAPYTEGLGKIEPCVPAICKCCYWSPYWASDDAEVIYIIFKEKGDDKR